MTFTDQLSDCYGHLIDIHHHRQTTIVTTGENPMNVDELSMNVGRIGK
jgi:hypothetical protein